MKNLSFVLIILVIGVCISNLVAWSVDNEYVYTSEIKTQLPKDSVDIKPKNFSKYKNYYDLATVKVLRTPSSIPGVFEEVFDTIKVERISKWK